MNKGFYLKLAFENLKKNARLIIPYIYTSSLFVMMYYLMNALANHSEFLGRQRGVLLELGIYAVGIFSILFIFFSNSMMIKQRKHEFGLYNILGLEKKHISKILFYESFLLGCISLIIGLIVGVIFGQFIFLCLIRLIDLFPNMIFEYHLQDFIETILLFSIINLCTYFYNCIQIYFSKPIDLMKNMGEKEPKSKWIIAIVGFICLIVGYSISIQVKNPVESILYFMVAILLVILGTYCLFTAGNIILLKGLRKNKSFYYQTNHFVSISNMMVRMKQNAIGLANICILSTMVLILLLSTLSLYVGIEDIVRWQAPKDVNLSFSTHDYELNQEVDKKVMEVFEKIDSKNFLKTYSFEFVTKFNENQILVNNPTTDVSNEYYVVVMSNEKIHLNDKEAIAYFDDGQTFETIQLANLNYHVKPYQEQIDLDLFRMDNILGYKGIGYILLKDEQSVHEFGQELLNHGYASIEENVDYYFDASLDKVKIANIKENILSIFDGTDEVTYSLNFQKIVKEGCYEIFGGFIFVGIFLSILFMVATTLVMYYRQMSEGYEDAKRYDILVKVGMSRKEIKKTIDSQMLAVFFSPLVVAGIHIIFSFNMIYQLFSIFAMNRLNLFIFVVIFVYLIFGIFYFIIYHVSAKAYYKIVNI